MTSLFIGLGGILIAAGALLLSPLTDLLPAQVYFWLKGQRVDERSYFKVTNEPEGALGPFALLGVALFAVGILLLGCAWFVRNRS